MTLPSTCDIAIVGGGLVGASLALFLAQQHSDWRIVLLEANGQPTKDSLSFDGRSTALAKGSQTLLQSIQVWENLKEKCAPIRHIQISDQGRWAGAQLSAQEFEVDALGYVAENNHLAQVLSHQLEQTEHISSFYSVRVQQALPSLRPTDNKTPGYGLQWQQGEQRGLLHTRLFIIADGAQSPLRQGLGIDADVHDYEQTAVVANIRMGVPHVGRAFERFTANGPLALLPLLDSSPDDQGRRMALVWTHPKSRLQDWQQFSDEQWLSHLQQAIGPRLGVIEHFGKRSVFPLHRVIASESIRRHLVIIGNAAHFLHPVAGQGFNLSLRDAARLAKILGEAWGNQSRDDFGNIRQLNAYQTAQKQDQQLTISGSHGLVKLFGNPSFFARTARAIGLWEMEQIPWIKRAFTLHTLGFAPYQLSDGFPAKG